MNTKPIQPPLPPDSQLDRAMDPEYAAISTLAVLGMVSALLGMLSFVSRPLMVLPALGLVLGWLAIRKIRRSEGILTGRGIALAAAALGALALVGSAAWHLQSWWSDQRTYEELSARSYEITDDILAGRYEKVHNMIPEEFRNQKGRGLKEFRSHIVPLLADAGSVIRRTLMSLEIVPTEDNALVAPAKMRVELERRYLEFQIVFKKSETGAWELIGIGVTETLDSQFKFAKDDPEPPKSPPPAKAAPKP